MISDKEILEMHIEYAMTKHYMFQEQNAKEMIALKDEYLLKYGMTELQNLVDAIHRKLNCSL